MSALGMLVELIGYAVARAALSFLSFGGFVSSRSAHRHRHRACHGTVATRMDGSSFRQDAAGWIGSAVCLLVLLAIVAIFLGVLF